MNNAVHDETLSQVISVSELNRRARGLIERGLPLTWIAGEISNFMRASSGHCYFSLKDAQAQVRCVIFKHKLQLHDWMPANGMQVDVRASPSLYEPRGEFQLNVDVIRRSGLGALYEAFEKLKTRLQARGWFDPSGKKPLPRYPRAVGVVTSLQAAALRDVLTTLRSRMPAIPVTIYPTPVQGEGAAARIAAAISAAAAHATCDVLIVCRGGGSIEDLWAFNEEIVAQALRDCAIPVVTGIGHETDFTIADFVADARAPTPTGAAQAAVPDRLELTRLAERLDQRLGAAIERILERRMQQLDVAARRLVHPGERLVSRQSDLRHLAVRMRSAWGAALVDNSWRLRESTRRLLATQVASPDLHYQCQHMAQRLLAALSRRVSDADAELRSLAAQLAQLNPQAVLDRGYAMVHAADGSVVRNADEVSMDQNVTLTFARGMRRARIVDNSN